MNENNQLRGYKMSKIELILGDCIEKMRDIPDDSIDLVVTSPPYNVKKKYETYTDNLDVEEYRTWIEKCSAEMFRLIKPNRSIFINISDIGVSNKDAQGNHKIGERGNFYVIPNHVFVISAFLQLPNAQYLNPIIWRKPSNHISQFGANARFCGTYPYPANCHVPSEIEYILHFRKNGKFEKIDTSIKNKSRVSKERWMEISGQIWEFNGVSRMKHHPAQFPIELPKRCIEGWSFCGDTVLDPFMGIGTTGVACKNLNRNFIGVEISEEYLKIADKRISESVSDE